MQDLLPKARSSTQCTVRPNNVKTWHLEQSKFSFLTEVWLIYNQLYCVSSGLQNDLVIYVCNFFFRFFFHMCARSVLLFITLCDPTDCSPPGSSVHGISQAKILEWVASSFSRGSSQPRDWLCVSCISCVTGRLFTSGPPGKPFLHTDYYKTEYGPLSWTIVVYLFCVE